MLIQSLSDCNETLTNNHLFRKLTLNHLAKPKFEHIKHIFLLKSRACIKYFSQKNPQKTQPTNQPNKQTKKPRITHARFLSLYVEQKIFISWAKLYVYKNINLYRERYKYLL